MWRYGVIALCIATVQLAQANDFEKTLVQSLIINQSITRFGQDFYRQFVTEYRELNGIEQHGGMVIKERPSARQGSRIQIFLKQNLAFQAFLSPASSDIESVANNAAAQLVQTVKRRKALSALQSFIDPDLAADEF